MRANKLTKTIIERPYYNLTIHHRKDDEDDSAVIREMFEANVYRFEGWKLEQDNPVVLDIGANIGAFTILVLKAMQELDRAVTIYAVEPEENNLELLEKNLEANPKLFATGSRVIIVKDAIGNDHATATITNESGSSRLVFSPGGQDVNVIPYDQLIEDHELGAIDFTKIDIEGSEIPLIEGASLKSLLKTHYYAIEFDELDNPSDFLTVIEPFLSDFSLQTWGIPAKGCNIYLENHNWKYHNERNNNSEM